VNLYIFIVLFFLYKIYRIQNSTTVTQNSFFQFIHHLFTKLEKQRTKVGEEIESIKIDHEQARKDYEAKFSQDQIMIGGMEKKAGGKMKGRWNDSKVKRGGGRSGGRGGMSKSQNFRSKPHVDGKF